MTPDAPIRIGISACLLGRAVRYDGGHKQNAFLTDVLAAHVEFVPVCPEVELGMGVPREAIRLVGDAKRPALVGVVSGTDHTHAMETYARRKARALDALDLCGYVLKKDSPSCGMERVRVHRASGGPPSRDGVGLFARALLEHAPLLPVEEEGRLTDARLRENWVERVFAYRRFRDLRAQRFRRGDVVAFHAAHKFQILAHDPAAYTRLGRMVARVATQTPAAFLDAYGQAFMAALAVPATIGRHVNVLEHVAGFVSDALTSDERAELRSVIADYRKGFVPLIVPITLLRHHARRQNAAYILEQTYLEPHPKELMLRNHV